MPPSYIFGPVPSRRLGRSLGVDVVPFKTCTYDCIYCQLGGTTCITTDRKEWVPLEDIVAELTHKLCRNPDYITLSGSGEPTLFSRLGELIDRIKKLTDVPVAVLTNGSLLWRKDVRHQLLNADLVIPSLDAGDPATFRMVNRPGEDVPFEKMLQGLIDFRGQYQGLYWLEVFLLEGITTIESNLAHLVKAVSLIKPDRVQLNTVTRPPAEEFAGGIPYERLTELASLFDPPAEVIAGSPSHYARTDFRAEREEILVMLRRRPCQVADIVEGLGMHQNEVVKHLEELSRRRLVKERLSQGILYYTADHSAHR